MENRMRYLDKAFVWLMSLVILLPNILNFAGNVNNYVQAESLTNVVDTVLYDGPDGKASVQATLDAEESSVLWTVNLDKAATEKPSAMKLEIDANGGGLGAPYAITTSLNQEDKEGILQIQNPILTPTVESQVVTFRTGIIAESFVNLSLRLLIEIVDEETQGLVTLYNSPLTKTITFAAPIPIVEESEPVEEIPEEPVVEEAESEVVEEIISEPEEIPEEIIEVESEVSEEMVSEKESKVEEVMTESSSSEESENEMKESSTEVKESETSKDEEESDIAEPVSKDYVHQTFPIPLITKKMRASSNIPGQIELNKTAVAIKGCRTYQVTLDIKGVPPVKPVDVVLILDKSGSMAEGTGAENRMAALKLAAIRFATLVLQGKPDNRVSVVQYDGPSSVYANGDQSQAVISQVFTNNLTNVTNKINALTPANGTNTEAGLIAGRNAFTSANPQNPNSAKVAILFTDGLPTASNGYQYNETTNTNTVHYTRAITASNSLKSYGNLFSIGLTKGMSPAQLTAARSFLNNVQNSGFYEAPTATDLESIFDSIYNQIEYYGKDGIVTDTIGDDFNLIESSLPAGATYNQATRTITWNIGTLAQNPKLTYKVQAKDTVLGSNNLADKLPTNKVAQLTYTDINNVQNQKLTFPVPTVHVPLRLEIATTDVDILLGDSIQLGIETNSSKGNYMKESGGTGAYTYAWYLGNQTNPFSTDRNPTVTPTSQTTYRVVVTDEQGCKTTGYIKVGIKTGQLVVHKKDEQGNLITNNPATFTLTDSNNTEVTQTTNAAGIATFNGLAKGTYTLVETNAPNGYINEYLTYRVVVGIEDGQVTVVVTDKNDETVESSPLIIINKLNKISIPVKKIWVDNNNEFNTRPESITVRLYQNGSEEAYRELTFGADWTDSFENLPKLDAEGNEYVYTIKEAPVPNYEAIVEGFEITNTLKLGSLTITKYDKENPDEPILLGGAEFEMQLEDGSIAMDIEGNPLQGTTVNGELVFESIPYGTYTLVETKAPANYQLPSKQWTIVISNEEDPNVLIEIVNKKQSVLPSTGGIGTPIFTMMGLIIMITAGLSFIRKNEK